MRFMNVNIFIMPFFSLKGDYFLTTNAQEPFAKGKEGVRPIKT